MTGGAQNRELYELKSTLHTDSLILPFPCLSNSWTLPLCLCLFLQVDQSSMSVMNVICIILCLMLIAFAYGSGHESALRGIVLGIIVVLFTILEVLLYRLNLEFGAQQVLCYMSLLLLLGVICTISLDHNPAAVDDGLWVTVVFVYMVYTGIPVSMSVALLTGILLPVLQVALTSRFLLRPADSKSEVRLGSY